MARQLKRWESPRSQGRNHKGKGGSARQRQRKKQFQRLRATLKQGIDHTSGKGSNSLPVGGLWGFLVCMTRQRSAASDRQRLMWANHETANC